MGKKGSWFSALKRAFTSSSKDPEKKNVKEKKGWGSGKSKHGEVNSFIPLYKEPSSIEKILGDAEREQYEKIVGHTEREQHHRVLGDTKREQKHNIFGDSERDKNKKIVDDNERDRHQKISEVAERERHRKAKADAEREQRHRLQQTSPKKVQRSKTHASISTVTPPNHAQISAIKIQAAYRGYMARKSYRGLKGLMRLQGVMRGQSVKRQTMNTMRCMQQLVRVQSQIRARRLQMTEGQKFQQHRRDDKEAESLSKWSLTHQSEGDGHGEWEDSVLTKEEIDARLQRKVEAVIKRERALAYAYSHQLLEVTSKSAHAVLSDIRSGGYPWWWNWLERHLPPETHPATLKPESHPSVASLRPGSSRSKLAGRSMHDHLDASTPRSITKPKHPPNRWQQQSLRDDDSLTSCPAYTRVPRYMTPTASAKAKKVRSSYVDDDDDVAPGREGRRRFAFGLGSSIGSLRWGNGNCKAAGGSLFGGKEAAVARRTPTARHKKTNSIGGLSVDSTVSLPVGVGRKPFR